MGVLSIILLAFSLAMDCTAVSLVQGIGFDYRNKRDIRNMLLMATLFGVFQGGMPVLGYYIGTIFIDFFNDYVQWAAMWLLIILGAKMIFDALHTKKEEPQEANWSITYLLLMAVATSIDAFATGIVFLSYPGQILLAALVIGGVAFAFSAGGCMLSGEISKHIKKQYMSLAGGAVLIFLGIKIWMDSQLCF